MTSAGSVAAPAALLPRARTVNLVRELAITQFQLKYTGSVLGYLWSLLKPAMLFAVYYVVFERLLGAGKATVNFPLQLLVGIVLWTFFQETISSAMSAIASNGMIIRRAFFPRSALVVASSISAALTFVINLSLIVVVAAPLGRLDLGLHSLLAVPLIVELYLLILGLSLLFSALFVSFRDLGHIWEVVSQVLFYGSAVIYPFTKVPTGLRGLVACNPVAQVIQDVRHVLVTSDPSVPWAESALGGVLGALPALISLAVLGLGIAVFRALSPRFAENL